MNYLLSFIFFAAFSMNSWANEAKNCSEPADHAKMYFGSVSKMEFGSKVDFKALMKSMLVSHAREIERVVNLEPEYTGPDSDYIPRLINLLREPAGGKYEAACIWALYKEGDYLREFSENEEMVRRTGYGLFRNGVLVAYFYSSIVVV